jgi:hypothetical protein
MYADSTCDGGNYAKARIWPVTVLHVSYLLDSRPSLEKLSRP